MRKKTKRDLNWLASVLLHQCFLARVVMGAVEHGTAAKDGLRGYYRAKIEEFELAVDQVLCASAPYFLGNVPSTVTATVVQERDAMGWDRERTAFFGFTDENTRQFRDGWEASTAFSAHYADGGAPSASGCGRIAE